jgi:hypothetical protein
MTYKNDSKVYKITNSNKQHVNYPFSEKLILDNDKIAIITHETNSNIRIGLVCNATISVEV